MTDGEEVKNRGLHGVHLQQLSRWYEGLMNDLHENKAAVKQDKTVCDMSGFAI